MPAARRGGLPRSKADSRTTHEPTPTTDNGPMSRVTLREVQPADLPFFFEHQREQVIGFNKMSVFGRADN